MIATIKKLLLKMLGLYLTEDEEMVLKALNRNGLKSMRVVGRGTLTMDAKEVRSTEKFKRLSNKINNLTEEELKELEKRCY